MQPMLMFDLNNKIFKVKTNTDHGKGNANA